MRVSKTIPAKFIIEPIKGGVAGYLVFIFLLLATKFVSYLAGNQSSFKIEKEDFLFSLIGFLLFFLIRLLENFKAKRLS